jgi:hypothetical protein
MERRILKMSGGRVGVVVEAEPGLWLWESTHHLEDVGRESGLFGGGALAFLGELIQYETLTLGHGVVYPVLTAQQAFDAWNVASDVHYAISEGKTVEEARREEAVAWENYKTAVGVE